MGRTAAAVLAFGLALGAAACNDTPLIPETSDDAPPAFAKQAVVSEVGNSYVLNAGTWNAKQTRAVEQAGGTVVFSHKQDGIGVAMSEDPDFLEKALASRAFRGGFPDFEVSGIVPVGVEMLEDASFDPYDDGFFGLQWNMEAIGAPAAWAAGCTGEGVRIAILDGGISSSHLDIQPNLDVSASASFVPGFAYDEDTEFLRHATLVAGIAAAPANGIGTIGVAPDATIIGVKVLDGGGGSFSWILQGFYYASTPQSDGGAGADIINMSLSGAFPKSMDGGGQFVAVFNKAMNRAARNGVLVVSAAGNEYTDLDHIQNWTVIPAQSGNGIAVSATAPNGWIVGATDYTSMASYTNFGNSVIHVAGPGGDFDSDEFYPFDMVLSPAADVGLYGFSAGTSMSAPAVAGVAALVMANNSEMNVNRVKTILSQTADDEGKPGHDPYYGHGFVNAYEACMM
jgi:subtilisin family serine protease